MACFTASRRDGCFAYQRQEGHGTFSEFHQHEGVGVGVRSYYERGGNGFALVNSLGRGTKPLYPQITFCRG